MAKGWDEGALQLDENKTGGVMLTTFPSILMQYFASCLSFKSNNNIHKYGVIQIL